MKYFQDHRRGAKDLQDAWFVAVIHSYFGIPWMGGFPVSGKGWLLFLSLGIYQFAALFLVNNAGAPMVIYILLVILGLALFYLVALPRCYWATKEELGSLWRR
jgi:hypothetical protein